MNAVCKDHSGHCARIESTEKNIADLWKAVSAMRAMALTGIASMAMTFIAVILSFIMGRAL